MKEPFYTDADGSLFVDGKVITLKLNSQSHYRNIGWFGTNKDGYKSYFKEEKESATFCIMDAWSVNYKIITLLPDEKSTINIRSEKYIYRITKEKALLLGKFMYFKASGIEKKIYIPKKYFNEEPI